MKAREKTTGGIIYGAVEYQSNTAEWRVKGRNIAGGFIDCPASDVVMLWNEPDMFFGESVETLGKCAFPVAVHPVMPQRDYPGGNSSHHWPCRASSAVGMLLQSERLSPISANRLQSRL